MKDAKDSLASGNMLFTDFTSVVNNSIARYEATNTGTTGTTTTPPTSTTFELTKTQASMGEEIAFNYAVTDDRTCTVSTDTRGSTTSRLLMNIAAGASGQ